MGERVAAGAFGGVLPALLAPADVPASGKTPTAPAPTAAPQTPVTPSTPAPGSGTPTRIRPVPQGFQNGADVVTAMRDARIKALEWRKFNDQPVAGEAWVLDVKQVQMPGALGGVVRLDVQLDADNDGTADLTGIYMNPDMLLFAGAPGVLVWYEGTLTSHQDGVVRFAGDVLEWPDSFP